MSLFPGNTSDSITLRPIMKEIKSSYGLGRLIVVADKGLNSSKNIDEICNSGDGYVVSQVLRGKKGKRYHEMVFDDEGYAVSPDGSYKYKLFTEEFDGIGVNGNPEMRKRKVLIYWDRKEADMSKYKRDEKLKKSELATKNNAYGIKKGFQEYTKENIVDKETGEILTNTKTVLSVDLEKAENDALFDGYFCIITSELSYDERKIREVYGGLWRIEQSFRIMKSDLYARPVFVWTDEHIRAHFLICFTALLIIRLIQHRMGSEALSAERIARALNSASCQIWRGGIIHLDDVGGAIMFQKTRDAQGKEVDTLTYSDKDEIASDYSKIQKAFGTGFYDIYPKQEHFNKFLEKIGRA